MTEEIRSEIQSTGPISFERFMELALYGEAGFYMRVDGDRRAGGRLHHVAGGRTAVRRRRRPGTSTPSGSASAVPTDSPSSRSVPAPERWRARSSRGRPPASTRSATWRSRSRRRSAIGIPTGVESRRRPAVGAVRRGHPGQRAARQPAVPAGGVRRRVARGARRPRSLRAVRGGAVARRSTPLRRLAAAASDGRCSGPADRSGRRVHRRRIRLLRRGTLVCIDYGVPRTGELAMRPWREWLRTYRSNERGGHYLRRCGRPGHHDRRPVRPAPRARRGPVAVAVPATVGDRRARRRGRQGLERAGGPARARGDADAQPGARGRGLARRHRARRLPRRRMAPRLTHIDARSPFSVGSDADFEPIPTEIARRRVLGRIAGTAVLGRIRRGSDPIRPRSPDVAISVGCGRHRPPLDARRQAPKGPELRSPDGRSTRRPARNDRRVRAWSGARSRRRRSSRPMRWWSARTCTTRRPRTTRRSGRTRPPNSSTG